MKTNEFKKVKPYTYYILRKSDGVKYHGVRYRNKVSPINDFGIKYFGSSKSNICSQFKKNPKNFTFRLGWTFDTEKEAIQYETKVNKKIYKKEDWANKAAFPAIHMDDEVIANISKALKGTRIGKKNNFSKEKLLILFSILLFFNPIFPSGNFYNSWVNNIISIIFIFFLIKKERTND